MTYCRKLQHNTDKQYSLNIKTYALYSYVCIILMIQYLVVHSIDLTVTTDQDVDTLGVTYVHM